MQKQVEGRLGEYESRLVALQSEIQAEIAHLTALTHAQNAAGNVTTLEHENKHGDKRRLLHEKAFIERESLLTQMLSSGDESYRAIYHAMIATLIWLGVKLILQDYSKRGIFIDFGLLTWAFDKFDAVLRVWICEVCIALCVIPLVQYVRHSHRPTEALRKAACVYIALVVLLYVFVSWKALSAALPPASGLIVMCEAARLSMKMHAYVREKVVHGLRAHLHTLVRQATTTHSSGESKQPDAREEPAVDTPIKPATKRGEQPVDMQEVRTLLANLDAFADFLPPEAKSQDVTLESLKSSQPRITIGDLNEEIGRFVFFTFCPTLVYRDVYPRNHGPINWVRAGVHTLNLAGVVLYTYVITRSLLVPLLEPVPPKSAIDIVMLIQGAMVPSILVFLLSFFGILHSWLNLWAELLKFADRQFYSSWWTATSWPAYYRRWNLVVGDFLHSYVYNDIQRAKWGRSQAEIWVFVISALIHELILACAFRFWYPALLAMFGGPGFWFMSLTRQFAGRFANVLLWLFLSVGLGMLTVMYSRELYARYGYEWQGMPGIPHTAPYLYDPALHPAAQWDVLDWLSYVFVPRSWLEFWRMGYAHAQ